MEFPPYRIFHVFQAFVVAFPRTSTNRSGLWATAYLQSWVFAHLTTSLTGGLSRVTQMASPFNRTKKPEALGKVMYRWWSPNLGGVDEGGSHVKMAENPPFWWLMSKANNEKQTCTCSKSDMNFLDGNVHVVTVAAALLVILCIGFLSSFIHIYKRYCCNPFDVLKRYTYMCYNHIRPWPTYIHMWYTFI